MASSNLASVEFENLPEVHTGSRWKKINDSAPPKPKLKHKRRWVIKILNPTQGVSARMIDKDLITQDMFMSALKKASLPMFADDLWLEDAVNCIIAFASLQPNWDGENGVPPSNLSRMMARVAVEQYSDIGLRPDKIAANGEGGVTIVSRRGRRSSVIDIDNDGVLYVRLRLDADYLKTEYADKSALNRVIDEAKRFVHELPS